MQNYLDQLTAMRMNRQNGHISPHKVIMMLTVIDLIASGDEEDNRINSQRSLVGLDGKSLLFPNKTIRLQTKGTCVAQTMTEGYRPDQNPTFGLSRSKPTEPMSCVMSHQMKIIYCAAS